MDFIKLKIRPKSLCALCALIFFTYLAIKYFSVDAPGICSLSGRKLTDKEFIILALEYEQSAGRMTLADSAKPETAMDLKCCTVDRKETSSFLRQIFNRQLIRIGFSYRRNMNDINARDSSYPFYESYITFNTCGRVVSAIGTTIKNNP